MSQNLNLIADEGEAASNVIPNDIRRRIAERQKNRQTDLIHQVALMESGLSAYADEQQFCDEFGVSRQELDAVKKWKRSEIERFKEEHREGKFMLVRLLGRRERYMMMLEDAMLKGDTATENRMKELLKVLKEHAPLGQLREIAETLKMVQDESEKTAPPNATQVNINVSPGVVEAEKRMKEIQAKTIDT